MSPNEIAPAPRQIECALEGGGFIVLVLSALPRDDARLRYHVFPSLRRSLSAIVNAAAASTTQRVRGPDEPSTSPQRLPFVGVPSRRPSNFESCTLSDME